jgi:Flp pilus assembly pilin Flp
LTNEKGSYIAGPFRRNVINCSLKVFQKGRVLKKLFGRLVSETEGQDLIEYALLATVIALGVTAAMLFLRDQLQTEFSNIGSSISAAS